MKKGKNNYLDTRCLILLCIALTYSIHILEMCAIEIDHRPFIIHMINVHQCLCSYMYVTVKLTRNVVFSSTYASVYAKHYLIQFERDIDSTL